jgi:hypothetical protein
MRYELREYSKEEEFREQKLLAHRVLDDVAAGQNVHIERINWALRVLGEALG